MSQLTQESLNELLRELLYETETETEHTMSLLQAAHNSFTEGANNFVSTSGKSLKPETLKNHLQVYPLAQILVAIIRYYEMNKDTEVIRDIVLDLLDSLETPKYRATVH